MTREQIEIKNQEGWRDYFRGIPTFMGEQFNSPDELAEWLRGWKRAEKYDDQRMQEIMKPWWWHQDIIIPIIGMILSLLSIAASIYLYFR
jgi:hypothetical protein